MSADFNSIGRNVPQVDSRCGRSVVNFVYCYKVFNSLTYGTTTGLNSCLTIKVNWLGAIKK